MKVAFLDRDGTIVEDYEDEYWRNVTKPVFLPGAIDALRQFRTKGYHLILITNQYLIGEGIITQVQYETFTRKMCSTLSAHNIELLDIFYCPDARSENSHYLKPNPGMIEAAIRKYPDIALKYSFFAGDSECDVLLANRVDLRVFGIGFETNRTDCIPVSSLFEASEIVPFIAPLTMKPEGME